MSILDKAKSIKTNAEQLPGAKQNRPMRENIITLAQQIVDEGTVPIPEPVPEPVLVSITVSPVGATVNPGQTVQFAALGTYENGTTKIVTPAWTASSGTITVAGLWSGSPTVGTYTITAKSGLLTASVTVTVVAVVPVPPPPPPPPPSELILFQDIFTGGVKAGMQNNCRWTGVNGSAPPAVVPDPTNPSGFSLRFRFLGNTATWADAFCEQNYELDPVGFEQLFFYLEWGVPANYFHRNDPNGSDNNKGFRIWGGRYATDDRDTSYGNSSVKAGYSTLPHEPGHARYGESKVITEFGNLDAVGSGNWSTGPWTPWFAKGTIEKHCMFVRRGTTGGTTTTPGIGGDAILKLWRNGVKVYDRADLDIYTTGGWNRFRYGYVLGWSNSGFTEQTDLLLRRIVIARDVIPELIAP